MQRENGEEYMKALEKDRHKIVKAYDHYQKLLIEYTELCDRLTSKDIK
jgi:hypothetical protein